ncbi:LPS-assembly protein LptD [Sandarakinorhabdus rubra]|uniref:LPS-assembly protein LptD n=1 Tax=Sandarakinorhabdus rubra TaxID=2672568 RepID=UPI0013DAA381|nr:LPS assembly protein LptD [Sandarakinorhabdus rubra]
MAPHRLLPGIPVPARRAGLLAAAALVALLPAPALAQRMSPATWGNPEPANADPDAPPRLSSRPGPGDTLDFEADQLTYNEDTRLVVASGRVQLSRDGYRLVADRVEYTRSNDADGKEAPGEVVAIGSVSITDPSGNQAMGDRITLTDSLRDGAIANMLLVLNDGGRLGARSATRDGGTYTLDRAAYSPCAVVSGDGCPQTPVWKIKAVQVRYDEARHRISYRNASLEMFGVPVLYLPRLSHPDGDAPRASGLLIPALEIQRQLGLGVSAPIHLAMAPDSDVTLTPWLYTATNPALAFQARRLLKSGPIQVDGMFTVSRRFDLASDGLTEIDRGERFRGYLGIKGRLQHSPHWRSVFSLRLTSDDTFNRRYGLGFDDTLRSSYALERITSESWLSISAWYFQGLRVTDRASESPLVLPLIDYDWRPDWNVAGGKLRFGANSMLLTRTDGQDLFRVIGWSRWDRLFTTALGQRISTTALVRGDLYDVRNSDRATFPDYAGRDGWRGRGVALAAIDIAWPFAGPAFGGEQTISPRVQLVAAPRIPNSGFANEDSRAFELEDISLFELNRTPGLDRQESGSRVTYGLEYGLDRAGWQLRAEIGQSLRLDGDGSEFADGTGFRGRVSDVVGRTTLKVGRLVEFTHRFRLDKDNLAVRRNEIDLTVGGRRTYVSAAYIRLNRNVTLEDLEDRQELRIAGRLAFARYWTLFGNAIVNLTTRADNPLATGNGFEPIRHRIGVEYEDECFRFGLGWRRDYVGDRDFRPGNNFQISIAFKTLGR